MANNATPKLKAFVQIDSTGRVVSGTPVFRASKPKSGTWREIPMYYRGDNQTTTTTTTHGGGSVTPTAFVLAYWLNVYNSCNNTIQGFRIFYSSSSTIQTGIALYDDAALTIPSTQGWVVDHNMTAYLINTNGVLSIRNCPEPTTTTTTTQGLFTINAYYQGSSSTNQLCPLGSTGSGPATIYSNTSIIEAGSMLYSSPGNPLTFGGFYYKQVGQNDVFYAPADNGVAVKYNCIYTYDLKSGSTQFSVCSGSVNLILYGNSPTLGIGQQLYTDNTLTTPYNPGSPILIGFGSGINDPVWQVNSTGQITSQFGAC